MMPLSDDSGDTDHWMIMNSLALSPPSPYSSPIESHLETVTNILSRHVTFSRQVFHNSLVHRLYWFVTKLLTFFLPSCSSQLWFLYFHWLWKLVVVHVSSVRLTLSGLSLAARAPCDWSLSAPGTGDTDTLYHEHTLPFSAKYTFQPAEKIFFQNLN